MNIEDRVKEALKVKATELRSTPVAWNEIQGAARRVRASRRVRRWTVVGVSVAAVVGLVAGLLIAGRSPQRSGLVGKPKPATIRVTQVRGPGMSEATGTTFVDRIFTDCDVVVYSYHLIYTGTISTPAPIRIRKGEMRIAANGSVANDRPGVLWKPSGSERLSFAPESGERDIVHNGHARLDQVSCVGRPVDSGRPRSS